MELTLWFAKNERAVFFKCMDEARKQKQKGEVNLAGKADATQSDATQSDVKRS